MPDILIVIGTRPELIKVAPIVQQLKMRDASFAVLNTGQHKELLEPYWDIFGFRPDYSLDVILPGQDLSSLTSRAIEQISRFMVELKAQSECPKYIIAQGDTTTVMATSLVAFYMGIRFIHVEAGLRSFDMKQPFPEEFNRRVSAIAAYHHFAPTELSRQNLVKEGISEASITVAGNTIVDSVDFIRNADFFMTGAFVDERINKAYEQNKQMVLITCHRRENQNENLENIVAAIADLASMEPDTIFIWPVHPNPNVRNFVYTSACNSIPNIILTEPLDYFEILRILTKCKMVLTDSGGIQEESPSFKVPVLILREVTERPEAVIKGYNKLVGAEKEKIIDSYHNFKPDYDSFENPYGDGQAGRRIVDYLLEELASIYSF